ncbi:hypothetical protein ACSQ67_025621 [Phaseolus vulgaris]
MSGRRSRASKLSQNEINDLVSRLQLLLPQINQRDNSRVCPPPTYLLLHFPFSYVSCILFKRCHFYISSTGLHISIENSDKFMCFVGQQSASKILKETCCHIRRLQEEVEQLSERLSELMDSVDINDIDRQILQNILQQC